MSSWRKTCGDSLMKMRERFDTKVSTLRGTAVKNKNEHKSHFWHPSEDTIPPADCDL